MDALTRIKHLVRQGFIRFTRKARTEMYSDGLRRTDVVEAILNATRIHKTLRSRSPSRQRGGERLYVIQGRTLQGTPVYTKGAIKRQADRQIFYILISAKTPRDGF